jgi:uncharacterized damage-inducible protein DinB
LSRNRAPLWIDGAKRRAPSSDEGGVSDEIKEKENTMTQSTMTRVEFRNEFERYLVLQEALAGATNEWIERTPTDKLDWVPIENPNVRFGDRVSSVTIRNLYIHMSVEEYVWMHFLKECEEGATVPFPNRPDLTGRFATGDLIGEAGKLHADSMQLLHMYTDADLRKPIRFADRDWTVMGFLWSLYAHRAYHLGNIDIYLRQSDTQAPNFFRQPGSEVA